MSISVAGGRSRLHLLDLGSCSKSKDSKALSLQALGNVVWALLNGQRHVPYRYNVTCFIQYNNISQRLCLIACLYVGACARVYVSFWRYCIASDRNTYWEFLVQIHKIILIIITVQQIKITIRWPFKCCVTLFSGKWTSHSPPRNVNSAGSYTFLTLICADPYTDTHTPPPPPIALCNT